MNAVSSSTRATAIDPGELRTTVESFASNVTIVTGIDDDGPIGLTCRCFYSVSLDPPLVSINVSTTSASWARIRSTGSFAVNMLAAEQASLSTWFGRSRADKWSSIEWEPAEASGSPLLPGTVMWVDCDLEAEYPAGDHVIIVGRVVGMGLGDPAVEPTILYKGEYRSLAPRDAQGVVQ